MNSSSATSASAVARCRVTDSASSLAHTTMAPSTAWEITIASAPIEAQRMARDWLVVHATTTVSATSTITTAATSRWECSIQACRFGGGVSLPKHRGQSGQPSPESVARTSPPTAISRNVAVVVATARRWKRVTNPPGLLKGDLMLTAPRQTLNRYAQLVDDRPRSRGPGPSGYPSGAPPRGSPGPRVPRTAPSSDVVQRIASGLGRRAALLPRALGALAGALCRLSRARPAGPGPGGPGPAGAGQRRLDRGHLRGDALDLELVQRPATAPRPVDEQAEVARELVEVPLLLELIDTLTDLVEPLLDLAGGLLRELPGVIQERHLRLLAGALRAWCRRTATGRCAAGPRRRRSASPGSGGRRRAAAPAARPSRSPCGAARCGHPAGSPPAAPGRPPPRRRSGRDPARPGRRRR